MWKPEVALEVLDRRLAQLAQPAHVVLVAGIELVDAQEAVDLVAVGEVEPVPVDDRAAAQEVADRRQVGEREVLVADLAHALAGRRPPARPAAGTAGVRSRRWSRAASARPRGRGPRRSARQCSGRAERARHAQSSRALRVPSERSPVQRPAAERAPSTRNSRPANETPMARLPMTAIIRLPTLVHLRGTLSSLSPRMPRVGCSALCTSRYVRPALARGRSSRCCCWRRRRRRARPDASPRASARSREGQALRGREEATPRPPRSSQIVVAPSRTSRSAGTRWRRRAGRPASCDRADPGLPPLRASSRPTEPEPYYGLGLCLARDRRQTGGARQALGRYVALETRPTSQTWVEHAAACSRSCTAGRASRAGDAAPGGRPRRRQPPSRPAPAPRPRLRRGAAAARPRAHRGGDREVQAGDRRRSRRTWRRAPRWASCCSRSAATTRPSRSSAAPSTGTRPTRSPGTTWRSRCARAGSMPRRSTPTSTTSSSSPADPDPYYGARRARCRSSARTQEALRALPDLRRRWRSGPASRSWIDGRRGADRRARRALKRAAGAPQPRRATRRPRAAPAGEPGRQQQEQRRTERRPPHQASTAARAWPRPSKTTASTAAVAAQHRPTRSCCPTW